LAYFDTNVIDRGRVVKETNKRKLVDRDILCAYVDVKTGIQCGWKTTDSSRQISTSNMKNHLAKHSIYPPSGTDSDALAEKRKQPDIWSFVSGKGNLGHPQILEKNLLRWMVSEKQVFTTIDLTTSKITLKKPYISCQIRLFSVILAADSRRTFFLFVSSHLWASVYPLL
jgi:hypothetical protein